MHDLVQRSWTAQSKTVVPDTEKLDTAIEFDVGNADSVLRHHSRWEVVLAAVSLAATLVTVNLIAGA